MTISEKFAASEVITGQISGKAFGPLATSKPKDPALLSVVPLRPAWLEIDLGIFKSNLQIILNDKPSGLGICSVVKDEAYGHGASRIAQAAAEVGIDLFAVSILAEAKELRDAGISQPILVFGERTLDELNYCIEQDIQFCVSQLETLSKIRRMSHDAKKEVKVHVKVDTGMSRYGARWTEAIQLITAISDCDSIKLEGVMSHFAMSDEPDKSFAQLQFDRFLKVLRQMQGQGIQAKYRHICNSGGFLDLPFAHCDLVRLGLLPLGVYPSQSCRRIDGIRPIMQVKTRIASIKRIEAGDNVGYGLRYEAPSPRRIGVLPIGYGDGYPRLRNQGHVLVHGKFASITGANAMDAMMVDLTEIPEAQLGDEVVLMGNQGLNQISAHDLAKWGNTVSYDILCGWRSRLPRYYINQGRGLASSP